MYIVSARKYRPDSFESLIGQDNIVQTLKNSIIRGQLAHAYLFCGPRGVGKTSAARIFAKTINCANPSADLVPCGECDACRSFQEGRSFCIHELDAASNNSVDDIKALIDQVNIPPQVGKYSVFIVDEVHMLSTQAFNAFLKTLEEPPAHAIFILATTEKHKILPTILSRCQTYDFNRISIPDIVRNLRSIADKEGISVDDESLHVIAMKADGAMRDALTIFDQTVAFCGTEIKYDEVLKNLNVLSYEHSFALVDAFLKGDYQSALLKFDEVLSKGFNSLHFVSALSTHLRDLVVAKSNALDALLELPASLKEKYREQAQRCPLGFLYEALSITTACESGYKASVNPRLHIEFALMKLSFILSKPSAGQSAQPSAVRQSAQSSAATAPVLSSEARQPASSSAAPVPAQASASASQQAAAAPASPAEATRTAAPETPAPSSSAPAETALPSRRRTAKKLVLNPDAEKSADTGFTAIGADSPIPSDDVLLEGWGKLVESYKSRPRLYQTLSSSKPRIEDFSDHKRLTFLVLNESQKQWIEQKLLRNLETNFCERVKCGKIRLFVEVTAVETVEKKSYMPAEQAIDLINSNPEVRSLVQDFGLDAK